MQHLVGCSCGCHVVFITRFLCTLEAHFFSPVLAEHRESLLHSNWICMYNTIVLRFAPTMFLPLFLFIRLVSLPLCYRHRKTAASATCTNLSRPAILSLTLDVTTSSPIHSVRESAPKFCTVELATELRSLESDSSQSFYIALCSYT